MQPDLHQRGHVGKLGGQCAVKVVVRDAQIGESAADVANQRRQGTCKVGAEQIQAAQTGPAEDTVRNLATHRVALDTKVLHRLDVAELGRDRARNDVGEDPKLLQTLPVAKLGRDHSMVRVALHTHVRETVHQAKLLRKRTGHEVGEGEEAFHVTEVVDFAGDRPRDQVLSNVDALKIASAVPLLGDGARELVVVELNIDEMLHFGQLYRQTTT